MRVRNLSARLEKAFRLVGFGGSRAGGSKTAKRRRLVCEQLECRQLLSVTAPLVVASHMYIVPSTGLPAQPGAVPAGAPVQISGSLSPAQVTTAYGITNTSGVNQISLNGVTGNGAGETVAVIDAFDDPDLLDSSDPKFREQRSSPVRPRIRSR